jgi:FAD/FMN-containing dehydrogenase
MVLEIEFVNGNGDIVHTSESDNPSLFRAMLCSLGALGIITSMTIKCEPAFNLECFEELKAFDWV